MIENVVCIGLDLAWSMRNPSGGAVLVGGILRDARADLGNDEQIVEWIGAQLSPGCAAVIAIDAPLRVPNQTGLRACERELGAQWRVYQAGPYPANRKNLAANGVVRGEALVEALAAHFGFVEAAPILAQAGGRFVCEVFPHPAHISLFGLPRILKYKIKRSGQYEAYWQEYTRYQALLAGLSSADPPLQGAEALLSTPAAGLRGKKLKQLEDQLDALTCAYVASYLWRHGCAGARVYGTVAEGHIVVPRVPPGATLS
jgi:predicted RNase H-like nuclease